MMQQCQENQLGSQQSLTQQMVLCPVKLVYDTQILVQPGDQIQPNQTIFINPQNPPPWIQNRMQNQVIYVQQVPNNYYQHQVDPNPVYIHNYPYQVQQQILAQTPQEQRPVQIGSLAPNIMQGLPNVHNITNVQNERLVERQPQINNFGQIPQQITVSRQAAPNVGLNQVHTQIPQQTIELHRPGYMNSNRPQVAVNANIRQQVMNAQNMPNVQQNIRQTFAPSISQQRPIQIHNNTANIQRFIQPTFTNPTQVQTVAKVLESITTVPNASNNKPTNVTTSVSNLRSLPNYAYRPIQPRPHYRHNVPNIGVLTQPIAQIQNIQGNSNNRAKDNRMNTIPNTITTVNMTNAITKTETQGNRKRKSESPDEIQKKISIISPSISINDTPKQSNVPLKNVNRSNVMNIARSENNSLNQNTILQLTNNGAHIVKLVDNGQQTNPIETSTIKPENTNPTHSKNKEKLVRNTVFTQARGRLLNDKEIVPNNVSVQDSKTSDKPDEASIKVNVPPDVIKIELTEIKNENNNLGTLKDQKQELNKSGLKPESNISTKEVQLKSEVNCEQQILTHVLDGYVIQESNMAFPIRRPLKEKIIYENTKSEGFEKDSKGDFVEEPKSETVKESKPVELPQLPLQNLQLDNGESDPKKDIDKGAPFIKILPTTVKSWTVDNLARHLTKYDWNETVSILQEHEIDGESLFLVSKTQLVQIGISEEHADAICDFVKH